MFGEHGKLGEMREKLNSVSPSFCLAKWKHVSLFLGSGHSASCYLPNSHKIPLDELAKDPAALHNTGFKKEQRRLMLEGKRPEECGICWSIEDLPGEQVSDRHYRGVDSWTMPFFDEVRSAPWNRNVDPSYVEVSFSSVCNFKCSYCSPHVSTAWLSEIEKHGPYQIVGHKFQSLELLSREGRLPLPEDAPNPYIDAFWEWWPRLVKGLMHFRITGGEPLLSKDTFRLLDWLAANPQPRLELSVNTNLGVPRAHFERFLDAVSRLIDGGKVKSFMLHTSLDTWGKQAEYIRHGLDFEQFGRNLDRFLTRLPTAQLAVMCTFNVLSVSGYRNFLEWLIEVRGRHNNDARAVLLDIPHLRFPAHLAARILPSDYRKLMEENILFMKARAENLSDWGTRGFRAAEIEKLCRVLEWMRVPPDPGELQAARRSFYLYFSEQDRRRGTNLLEVFPDLREFWFECKALSFLNWRSEK